MSYTAVGALGREASFVNREEELVQLFRLLDQSFLGKGQVVLVTGEGGVGKTRLVQEFSQRTKSKGLLFAVGRSFEEEELVPYAAWVDVLRTVVRQVSAEKLVRKLGPLVVEVGRLVPELAVEAGELGIKGWLSGPMTTEQALIANAEKIRLFQSITDILVYASKEKPLTVLLDDVQWADIASVQLLGYVGRRIRDERIMIISTYRETELLDDHPLSRLLLDLNRERILTKIPLNRLSIENVAVIIANSMGGGKVSREFAQLIHSRTGGNPFFVEEVLRSLSEEGRIYKSDTGWTLREIGQVEIPSTVRALIRQRVSRLGEHTSRLLSMGATIGTDFQYELLQKVSGLDEDQIIGQIEKAVRAGLVREQHSGKDTRYVFADEQVREFLYNDLSHVRRRKLHAQVASGIEHLFGHEKDRHLEELSYHFILGGNVEKAAEFSLMAGDRAARLHAYPDARKHYQNVLDLIGDDASSERLVALARLGAVFFRMGEYANLVQTYQEAVSMAEQLKRNREAGELYSNLAWAHFWLGLDKEGALENYRKALAILEREEGHQREEARIYQEVARILVNTLEKEEGLHWCEKAIRIAREAGASDILAEALQTHALGLPANRNTKAAIVDDLNRALEISLKHQLEDSTCRAYLNLGSASCLITAESRKAEDFYLKGLEYSAKTLGVYYEAALSGELATFALIPLGEWDRAVETANHALKKSSELHDFAGRMWALLPAGTINLLRGNLKTAEEQLLTGYQFAEKSTVSEMYYAYTLALGRLYRNRNELEKAESYFLKCLELSNRVVWREEPCEALFELVRLHLEKGDGPTAARFSKDLRKAAEELDEKWAYALASWADGLLAAHGKNWSDAVPFFRKSSELWKDLDHNYYFAQTILELGKALKEGEDAHEANRWVEEAQSIFTQLGAKPDLTRLASEA